MKLEVLSKEPNATNWILAGFKRRTNSVKEIDDELCNEVAEELKMRYTKKENGDLLFEDKVQ